MSDKDLVPEEKSVAKNDRFERVKDTAVEFAKTPTGKLVIKGAAAGAAIGLALPGITILAGAAAGAGGLVLWKAFKEKN